MVGDGGKRIGLLSEMRLDGNHFSPKCRHVDRWMSISVYRLKIRGREGDRKDKILNPAKSSLFFPKIDYRSFGTSARSLLVKGKE